MMIKNGSDITQNHCIFFSVPNNDTCSQGGSICTSSNPSTHPSLTKNALHREHHPNPYGVFAASTSKLVSISIIIISYFHRYVKSFTEKFLFSA